MKKNLFDFISKETALELRNMDASYLFKVDAGVSCGNLIDNYECVADCYNTIRNIKYILSVQSKLAKQGQELLTSNACVELTAILSKCSCSTYPQNCMIAAYKGYIPNTLYIKELEPEKITIFLEYMETLPAKQKSIIESIYKENLSVREVAQLNNLSVARIRAICEEVYRQIRKLCHYDFNLFRRPGEQLSDIEIGRLELKSDNYNSLKRAGLNNLRDLCDRISESGYNGLRNFGESGIYNVITKCKQFGITLEEYYIQYLVKNNKLFTLDAAVYVDALHQLENKLLNYYELSTTQREYLLLGQAAGVDVIVYANGEYKSGQMFEIYKGLVKGIDITKYCDSSYSYPQMRQIRLGLEDSVDISIYNDPSLDFEVMEQIRLGLKKNLDVNIYNKKFFNAGQMKQIRLGLEKCLDINIYNDPELSPYIMEQIRLGLEKGLDINRYNNSAFNAGQMEQLRLGLEKGLDISRYNNVAFDAWQMRQLRLGLEDGLDISRYSDPSLLPYVMAQIRQDLLEQKDSNSMNLF